MTYVNIYDASTNNYIFNITDFPLNTPDGVGIKGKVNENNQIQFSPFTLGDIGGWFILQGGNYVPQRYGEFSMFQQVNAASQTDNSQLKKHFRFQAIIDSNSLTTKYGDGSHNYTVRAFIKAFTADYGENILVFSNPLTTGYFSIEMNTTEFSNVAHLQWGFEMDGYPVYLSETNQVGYITISNVPSCYGEGTKIVCLIDQTEQYIPIQHIKNGTLVKTYQEGYKAVELVGKSIAMINDKEPTKSLYKLKGDNATVVTGGHYMLEDELPDIINDINFYCTKLKFGDKWAVLACDSKQVEKVEYSGPETIYHLVLESEDETKGYGIYVEGTLSESQCKRDFLKAGFELLG